MDFSNLFSLGSDNLFKFLFLNGILLVVISLFYPIQKQNELDLQIIEYNKKVDILNNEINSMKKSIKKFEKQSIKIKTKTDSLKKVSNITKSKNALTSLSKIRISFNMTLDSLQKKKNKLDLQTISIKSDKEKVKILSKQSDKYNSFSNWFVIIGAVSFSTGLVGWSYSAFIGGCFKREELKKLKREISNMP
jgi:septal ring factor EnvC (AmiA/AmiB activator)